MAIEFFPELYSVIQAMSNSGHTRVAYLKSAAMLTALDLYLHSGLAQEDIAKGLSAYSTDLLADICYEINDIVNNGRDILYAFIGCSSKLSQEEIVTCLTEYGIESDSTNQIIDLLLWYGFIGIEINHEAKYIYDFNYSILS